MNLNKSVLLMLVILTCFAIPGVLSNFTVLKNLLSVFKSSPAKDSLAESLPANETTKMPPAESLPVESLPAESGLTDKTVKPAEQIDHQSISVDPLVPANQRSALISEDDHKFSPAAVFKNGLFRGNLISHLQDLIKRKSAEASEQSAIVNDEDVDEEKESEDEPNQEDSLVVSSSKHNEAADKEDSEDDSEQDDDDDEDEFTGNFHKKSASDEPEADSNDLKLPPRRKLIEQIFEQLEKEIKSLAAIVNQTKDEARKLGIEYNKTNQLNEKAEQEMKQVMALRDTINETQTVQSTVQSNETVQANEIVQSVEIAPANETDQQPSIKSFSKFDNTTNTTSYTYLGGEQPANSDPLPAVVQPQLLGNTLESLEKILGKYTFLNLYPAPTINDTHNDRDLQQDNRVVLKANFADYPGYANTEKSPILGQAPPVQNLTDISYGNVRADSGRVEGEEKIETVKN